MKLLRLLLISTFARLRMTDLVILLVLWQVIVGILRAVVLTMMTFYFLPSDGRVSIYVEVHI